MTGRRSHGRLSALNGVVHQGTSVTEQGWQLSVDATDRLDDGAAAQLAHLQRWLATHMRQVRLPDLTSASRISPEPENQGR